MLIIEVYKKYRIPPNLQDHQLRVAAVAEQICVNLTVPVDSESVIKASLIHDMGNILKFDLSSDLLSYLKPRELDFYRNVKEEFKRKYGPDEHEASLSIARELGSNEKVLACIKSVDFGKTQQTAKGGDLEVKICDVADLRVGPYGVISIQERLIEGRKRYKNQPDKWISSNKWQELSDAIHEIENQIFSHCKIKPADITDESIAPIIEELKTYEI